MKISTLVGCLVTVLFVSVAVLLPIIVLFIYLDPIGCYQKIVTLSMLGIGLRAVTGKLMMTWAYFLRDEDWASDMRGFISVIMKDNDSLGGRH